MIPQTLNGGTVLSFIRKSAGKSEGYVLVQLPENAQEYVTAYWQPELKDTWAMGHYYSSFDDADRDLQERAYSSNAVR